MFNLKILSIEDEDLEKLNMERLLNIWKLIIHIKNLKAFYIKKFFINIKTTLLKWEQKV